MGEELMFDLKRDRFSLLDRCAPIHRHVELRHQAMTEPARAYAENLRRLRSRSPAR